MTAPEPAAGRLERAYRIARERLLGRRHPAGHWRGELSTSALSTATATFALRRVDRARDSDAHARLVRGGEDWLAAHANEDGGWGDTVRSRSNLPTTVLAWSALSASGREEPEIARAVERARRWIEETAGSLEPAALAREVTGLYGQDRTFSVPILTCATLAGCLGEERDAWKLIPALPHELAALPRGLFRFVGLPVVSYALPALVSMGLVHHRRSPSAFGPLRWLREVVARRALGVADACQPRNGGYLEAVPLTSFVTISLVGAGESDSDVVRRAVGFLEQAVRADGSWPIDSDLATWVTTLSVNALGDDPGEGWDGAARARVREWLLAQQYDEVHPFTGAAPGAWAWTDLPGGVPDADDTAGAILALKALGGEEGLVEPAIARGARWLLDLQNRDGGTPTFCRGWGKLPFDRSGADLTAHALRALLAAGETGPEIRPRLLRGAIEAGCRYLGEHQGPDGTWLPLWFGNEHVEGFENPVFGTTRVLSALHALEASGLERLPGAGESLRRAEAWLVASGAGDGGWGGGPGAPSSIEETALAVEALARSRRLDANGEARLEAGLRWLIDRVESGEFETPAPIGFYFANLWYHEALYPLIFTVGALRAALERDRSREAS